MNSPGDGTESLLVRFLTAPAQPAVEALCALVSREFGGGPGGGDAMLAWRVSAADSAVRLSVDLPTGTVSASVALDRARAALGGGLSVAGLLLASALTGQPDPPEIPAPDAFRLAVRAARATSTRIPNLRRTAVVEPPLLGRARTILAGRHAVGILGHSGSGKSVLGELLITEYRDRGHAAAWLNLGDPDVTVLGCLAALMSQPAGVLRPSVAVLDDLQGNPAVAAELLRLLGGNDAAPRLALVAIGWPSVREIVERTLGATRAILTDGRETCRRIIEAAETDPAARAGLLAIAGQNALVASIAVELAERHGTVPDQTQVAERAYAALTSGVELDEAELRGLWLVSSLAMFEIDIDLRYVSVDTRAAVQAILRGRMLRQRGDYVTFGHRTFARLIVRHLRERRLVDAATTEDPIRLAVQYLRTAGDNQIRSTLDRLDLVAPEGRGNGGGAAFLAEAWNSARILGRYLARQVDTDPTWADNVASAVFAAEALADLGLVDQWRQVAGYVRRRWRVDESADLPTYTGERPAESDDFVEIAKRMREEDRQRDTDVRQPADEVDLDRFHRTWVLGLLLGFEAVAVEPDEARVAALRMMASRVQAPDGSFYPARVPWVTARVCLGLSAFGDTVATSPVLRDAVNWLRGAPPYGPSDNGVWQSGTGTWNTALMTSAMVLQAIGAAGVGTEDRSVSTGLRLVLDARSDWQRRGQELDCAQAVEAALILGEGWHDLADELRYLIAWARDSRAWAETGRLASEVQDESSKVPYVARALIAVTWQTVREELPVLLERRAGTVAGPAAGPTVTGVDAVKLRRAEAALRRLTDFIVSQMSDREVLLSRGQRTREVQAAWEMWRDRAVRCENLTHSVQAAHDRDAEGELGALIAEVDEFGREIQGALWRPIQAG